MIPEPKIQELWAAARRASPSDKVPYAFENRVMAAIRAPRPQDAANPTLSGLWRAALVSVALAMVSTGLDLAVQDPTGDGGVEETLEWAVMPVDVVEPGL